MSSLLALTQDMSWLSFPLSIGSKEVTVSLSGPCL